MTIRTLLFVSLVLVSSCGGEPAEGPVTFVRCNGPSDCPAHLPECLAYSHDGFTGSFCSKTCTDFFDCQIENTPVRGACIKVANGMHDPLNGQGKCFAMCDAEFTPCSDETIFECVELQDADTGSVCAPIDGEF